jgi:hypothetical protein
VPVVRRMGDAQSINTQIAYQAYLPHFLGDAFSAFFLHTGLSVYSFQNILVCPARPISHK